MPQGFGALTAEAIAHAAGRGRGRTQLQRHIVKHKCGTAQVAPEKTVSNSHTLKAAQKNFCKIYDSPVHRCKCGLLKSSKSCDQTNHPIEHKLKEMDVAASA